MLTTRLIPPPPLCLTHTPWDSGLHPRYTQIGGPGQSFMGMGSPGFLNLGPDPTGRKHLPLTLTLPKVIM